MCPFFLPPFPSSSRGRLRACVPMLLCLLIAPFAHPTPAAAFDSTSLRPDAGFLQMAAGENTQSASLGLQWQVTGAWNWTPSVDLTGHLEVEFGRWRSEVDAAGVDWAWVSQLSLVPILRWSGRGEQGWYVELGIGPSYLTPIFQARGRRFSSQFQFRDHIGVGRRWGEAGRHDLSLRFEHFSNAGIERPNPGINRVALRYTRRF
jgi:lipid A 3-O-deacylase